MKKRFNQYELVVDNKSEARLIKWSDDEMASATIIRFKKDIIWVIDKISIHFFKAYEHGLGNFVKDCLKFLDLEDNTEWEYSDETGLYHCAKCGSKAPYDVGSGAQICPRFCYNCGKEVKN